MTIPDHQKSARRGAQVGVETHFNPLKEVFLVSFHNYLLGKLTYPTLGERKIIFESASEFSLIHRNTPKQMSIVTINRMSCPQKPWQVFLDEAPMSDQFSHFPLHHNSTGPLF